MKVEVLGTRGKVEPSAPKYKNHSGFLIDEKILLDLGEPHFLELHPEAIVFTHFHPDHGYFIYNDEEFLPEVPHYGPEEHLLLPRLQVIRETVNILGYSFSPVPVIHALNLKSWGYVVEKDDKRIFFTGDVAWIEKAHLNSIGQVDLVITEATMIEKGGRINRKENKIYGHTGIPDLIRILSPLTKKLVFTHYGDWFFEDIEKSLEKLRDLTSSNLKVVPAHDGFRIEI